MHIYMYARLQTRIIHTHTTHNRCANHATYTTQKRTHTHTHTHTHIHTHTNTLVYDTAQICTDTYFMSSIMGMRTPLKLIDATANFDGLVYGLLSCIEVVCLTVNVTMREIRFIYLSHSQITCAEYRVTMRNYVAWCRRIKFV
jgi:hypothetical protein